VNGAQGLAAQTALIDRAAMMQGQMHKLDETRLEACIKVQDDAAIKTSLHEGDALGVSATPTLFVNGEEMDGALPIAELRAVLDRALTQAGVQPPVHADANPAPVSSAPPK